jgi:ssDNA-binding Zn-finger/Zn-ribbon topoisomerase 1
LSYLTCPTCRFTVSAAAARSPFQNCPRCLLRGGTATMMVATTGPRRFGRRPAEVERIAEAKARLSGPARGVRSA